MLLQNAAGNPQEISEAVRSVVNSIASIPDEIERISYVKECSRMFDIEEKVISKQVAFALLNLQSLSRKGNYQDFSTSVELPQKQGQVSGKVEDVSSKELTGLVKSDYKQHEQELIKYCIRYAYLPISEENESQFVIDFIAEELEADNITFTSEEFLRIFTLLKERKEYYISQFPQQKEEVERRLQIDRDQFRESLRQTGGSLAKIKAEEEKYLKEEEKRKRELLHAYTQNFSIDYLINHEENGVRQVATLLVAERHTLSSIYFREGMESPSEEDKLSELVPRALSELRTEILNNKLEEIQQEVEQAIATDNHDELTKLMEQLSKILYIRSRIAENLGERIISPR